MRRLRLLRMMVVGLLLAPALSSALAQDHLAPIDRDDALNGYRAILRKAFAELHGADSLLTVTQIPSFQNESAVGLLQGEGETRVVVIRPKQHLWRYELIKMYDSGRIRTIDDPSGEARDADLQELQRGLPADPEDVELIRCERRISAKTVRLIEAAWAEMMRNARAPNENDTIYLDGTSFDFTLYNGIKEQSGTAHGGFKKRVGDIVELGLALADYCEGNASPKKLDMLARKVTDASLVEAE